MVLKLQLLYEKKKDLWLFKYKLLNCDILLTNVRNIKLLTDAEWICKNKIYCNFCTLKFF